jgi:hypothetical protein
MIYPPLSLARVLVQRLHRTKLRNSQRAERRRQLYREDPIWRLTKNKDNVERRLRAKRAAA